jgi:hypothetical protein
MEDMMKHKYIRQLPVKIQHEIYLDVSQALQKSGLRDEELEPALEGAMDSKLVNLEDTIDIKKYL